MLRPSKIWYSIILLVFLFSNVLLSPALAAGFPFKRVPFDGHVHTWYSDEDPMTLNRRVKSAAEDVKHILGKESAFAVTDHTDVIVPGALRSFFTHADWVGRAREIEGAGVPVIIIPGLELTVGKKGEKTKTHGHFLVYGLEEYAAEKGGIPGLKAPFDDLKPYKLEEEFLEIRPILGHHYNLGDKVLWPIVWAGDPARKDVKEVLEEVGAAGAFGYIAHPNGGLGSDPGENKPGKDYWTPYTWNAIRLAGVPLAGRVVKGIEIFSAGHYHDSSGVIGEWDKTLDTLAGKFYCNILRQGVNFFVIGGSDNHNYVPVPGRGKRGVPAPIGSSYTYLLFKDGKPAYNQDDILNALKKGHTVATLGGPFVALTVEPVAGQEITVWEADAPHDTEHAGEPPAFPGDTVKAQPGQELKITVWWEKAPAGSSLRVYSLGKGVRKMQTVFYADLLHQSGEKSFTWKADPAGAFLIARLEKSGSLAYTSPVFIDPPGVKRPAVDVALVIDCSGSMRWNDPQGLRKEAAKQFIDLMQEGEKVAVVGFNHEAYLFAALQEIKGPVDRESLKQAVDRVFARGWTDIDEGLLLADQELAKEILSEVRKAVVLLTDGVPEPNPYQGAHRQLQDRGVRVYTISLGRDTDPVLLQRIAQETGGRYFEAPDAQALTAIYQELSAAVVGGEAKARESEQFTTVGETKTRTLTVAPGILQATFGITWAGSDFDFTLTRPDGRELTPQSPDPDYSFIKGPTYAYYTVDNPLPGDWTCTITAKDIPSGGETVNLSLTALVQTPPEISISGPASGSLLKEPFTVTATVYDPDGISEFSWFLDNYELTSVLADNSPSVFTAAYTLDPAQLPDGVHIITAWAADANFTATGADLDFIVDNTPPVANPGPDREARAGEEIIFDASGSKDAALYLWDFGDRVSTGSDYPYAVHTYARPGSYTVTLTVYDDAGNRAAATCRVKVRPASPGGGGGYTVPRVERSVPPDGATGVPVDTVITITFSEAVRAGSGWERINLKNAAGESVALTKELEGKTLYLKPASLLAPGTRYTLFLPAAAVKDLEGINLARDYSLSFTTAALRPAPVPFPDVPPGHWAAKEIGTLAARNVIAGYPDGSFQPEKPLLRAELAALLAKFLDLPAGSDTGAFSDVAPDAWYAGAVATVREKGLMSGASGKFRPNAILTREELAAVALRVAGITVQNLAPTFADAQEIASWARQAVATAAAAGLVKGVGENRFAPKAPVTRAQAAAILYRLTARRG